MTELIRKETAKANAEINFRTRIGLAIKRAFDIIVSILFLIIASPFLGLIAIAIKRDTPGPVFYRGLRVGMGGKPFKILKFRTMYETDESYSGPRVTAEDDPRITPLGSWLRDTKLNELPQFWNVLVGEMSLVGPRPEDPSLAKTWPQGAWKEILSVRPGITSPASVLYHDEESLLRTRDLLEKYLRELSPNKQRLDQLYVRYRSFWLDFDLLLWTFLIMIPRVGSKMPPEELLFLGPISRFIRRYMNWFFVDLLVTVVSIGFAGAIWRISEPLHIGWPRAPLMALGFVLFFSLAGVIGGINRVSWEKAASTDVYVLFLPWIVATSTAIWINSRFGFLPPGLVLVASLMTLAGFIAVRYHKRWTNELFYRLQVHLKKSHGTRERVLIVGSGRTAEHIAWILKHPSYSGQFRVVGFVDDDLLSQGLKIYGARIIGTFKDLPDLLKRHDVGLVILADHRISYRDFATYTQNKHNPLIKVLICPDLYGSINLLIPRRNGTDEEEMEQTVAELPCRHCLVRLSAMGLNAHPGTPEQIEVSSGMEADFEDLPDLSSSSQWRGNSYG